jgi:hypothetical protein
VSVQDILAKMNGGEFIGLVAVVMGCLTGACGIVAIALYHIRHVEYETGLKRELVAAGVSAEDIERIVNATAGGQAAADIIKARTQAEVEKGKVRGF